MFNTWYNYKEPHFDLSPKKKAKHKDASKKLNKSDSDNSYLDSEFVDEEELLKEVSDNFLKAKFSLLIKSLNLILLKKSDPFVAKMFKNYLRVKRKGRGDSVQKNFYSRMQEDIKKRGKPDSANKNATLK